MSHRRLSETWIQRQSPKNIGKPTTSHWMLEKAHASNLLQCSGIWSRLLPLQYRIASFKPASSHEPQSAISKSWGNGVDMSSPASAWAAKTDILDLAGMEYLMNYCGYSILLFCVCSYVYFYFYFHSYYYINLLYPIVIFCSCSIWGTKQFKRHFARNCSVTGYTQLTPVPNS